MLAQGHPHLGDPAHAACLACLAVALMLVWCGHDVDVSFLSVGMMSTRSTPVLEWRMVGLVSHGCLIHVLAIALCNGSLLWHYLYFPVLRLVLAQLLCWPHHLVVLLCALAAVIVVIVIPREQCSGPVDEGTATFVPHQSPASVGTSEHSGELAKSAVDRMD